MIKEALEYVAGMSKQVDTVEFNGRRYAMDHLTPMKTPTPEPLKIASLNGLIALLDDLDPEEEYAFHIRSYKEVALISATFDVWEVRDVFGVCSAESYTADVSRISGLEADDFIISLLTKFEQSENRDLLIKVASSMTDTSENKVEDDGITQSTTVGRAIKTKVKIPNPVILKPRRTFPEIDQPLSPYVFRIERGHSGCEMSLYQGDSGVWKMEALKKISEFLKKDRASIPVYY